MQLIHGASFRDHFFLQTVCWQDTLVATSKGCEQESTLITPRTRKHKFYLVVGIIFRVHFHVFEHSGLARYLPSRCLKPCCCINNVLYREEKLQYVVNQSTALCYPVILGFMISTSDAGISSWCGSRCRSVQTMQYVILPIILHSHPLHLSPVCRPLEEVSDHTCLVWLGVLIQNIHLIFESSFNEFSWCFQMYWGGAKCTAETYRQRGGNWDNSCETSCSQGQWIAPFKGAANVPPSCIRSPPLII